MSHNVMLLRVRKNRSASFDYFTVMRAKAPRSVRVGARLCRRPAAAILTHSNAVNPPMPALRNPVRITSRIASNFEGFHALESHLQRHPAECKGEQPEAA